MEFEEMRSSPPTSAQPGFPPDQHTAGIVWVGDRHTEPPFLIAPVVPTPPPAVARAARFSPVIGLSTVVVQ